MSKEAERLARAIAGTVSELTGFDYDEAVALAESALAEARKAALDAALTPAAEIKAALIGEFSISLPRHDEDGHEYTAKIIVPWTTVKEIMGALRALASKEAT